MREIKFRAWDKNAEQMIGVLKLEFLFESERGILAEGYCNCKGGITQNHESHKHEIFPENLELMQFTGLKDKNGKEIYEGDILRAETTIGPDGDEHNWHDVGVVEWGEFHWRPFMSVLSARCEIMGNIYENPELLK